MAVSAGLRRQKQRSDPLPSSAGSACWQGSSSSGAASTAASSVFTPRAIAAQNLTRSSRQATVGRPGEGIWPRYSRTCL